jgi:hypothetical protein
MVKTHRRYEHLLDRIEANSAYFWPERPGPEWDGTPCQLWLGPRNGSGYPRMCMRMKAGKAKGKPRAVAVHRIVIELATGTKMPKRKGEAMHLCNEQLCCAKTHLKPGTKTDNEHYKLRTAEHHRLNREPGDD